MPDQTIEKEQLCIGLYIHLDLPWMKHPFFTSSFKIRSEKQLNALRGLHKTSFRFDPDKSDTQPLPPADQPIVEKAARDSTEDALWEEKRRRIEVLKVRRSKLNKTAKRYEKSVDSMRKLTQVMFASPEEAVHMADEVVETMVSELTVDTEVTIQLVNLKGKSESSYYHSLNVAALSLVLGQKMGLSPQQLRVLGLGALFHDLGHQEIPSQILLKKKPRNPAEEKVYQRHPFLGVQLANRLGVLPEEAIDIIGQHHERLDGSGYPKGLKGEVGILPRIVAIVDHYDELCNQVDPDLSLSPFEAVSLMYSKERSKYDMSILTAFIANLGIYPPGTVVRLSDQRIACVVNINHEELLKPNVLVYDPEVPKEEALILDLMEEDLTISDSCRRSDLSPEVLNYLNLSEYVTYYVDQTSGSGSNR